MASTRATSSDDGAGLLGAMAALRWSRPDLSADLADHVLEIAGADADDATWLRAAGWAVHARSATGDGRECASDILDGVARRGVHLLDHPAADRLRVELAVLAAAAGRSSAARTLLTPVTVAETALEMRADALCALARCAMQDRPSSVDGLAQWVEATWAEVGGHRGELGSAVAFLVAAAAERRSGRAAAAVDRAAAGLACLDRARGGRSQSPSRYLAAGLAAEWISGLQEAGRVADAREGCVPLGPQLREQARPSRQLALLRLTVARTVATTDSAATAAALEQAALDAAGSDAPDLEALCWSTLGALQEKTGSIDRAVESMRRGLDAQQRDAQRGTRFRAALDAVVPPAYDDSGEIVAATDAERPARRVSESNGSGRNGHHDGLAPDVPAVPQADVRPAAVGPDQGRSEPSGGRRRAGDRAVAVHHQHDGNGNGPGANPLGVPGPPAGAGDPLQSWSDDSPIGKLLAQSLREPEKPAPPADPDRSPPPAAAANPWSTGSWSPVGWHKPERAVGWVPSDAAVQPAPAEGRRRRVEPESTRPPADPLTDPLPDLDAATETGSGSWLKDAMAELDRTLPAAPVAPPAAPPAAVPVVPAPPEAEGCVVVIDLARDGRRFAGRRAAAVVRAVADQLDGNLPRGGRLRHDDADALSVVLPGWSRFLATEWMHSTLPVIFENVVTADELPGTRLRAAVHDVDGPVGAQLLQQLDTAAAPRADAGPSTAPLWQGPASGDGRHGSSGRAAFRVEDAGPPPASGGRRRRREQEGVQASPEPPAERPDPTEGLGLADLLAGALAAYRSI